MNQKRSEYYAKGYSVFGYDERLAAWVDSARDAALATLDEPQYRHWWRCRDTWFAGVNALNNDSQGSCQGGIALQGEATDFIMSHIHGEALALDRAQVSVCRAGYPQRGEGESPEAHAFRLRRDAAHLDGLLKCGDKARRYMREYHSFILGIGMHAAVAGAAPFVVYEESHKPIAEFLRRRLRDVESRQWGEIDLTDEYKAVRAETFAMCRRVEVPLSRGEAIVVHRFAIHGTAPWTAAMQGERMLTFFRPPINSGETNLQNWLNEI